MFSETSSGGGCTAENLMILSVCKCTRSFSPQITRGDSIFLFCQDVILGKQRFDGCCCCYLYYRTASAHAVCWGLTKKKKEKEKAKTHVPNLCPRSLEAPQKMNSWCYQAAMKMRSVPGSVG